MTKTTTNKARRNGLAIAETHDTDAKGDRIEIIEIMKLDEDGEPWDEYIAAYQVNADGSLSYHSSCTHARDNDMPAHIRSEQHLRDLLPEFARVA